MLFGKLIAITNVHKYASVPGTSPVVKGPSGLQMGQDEGEEHATVFQAEVYAILTCVYGF